MSFLILLFLSQLSSIMNRLEAWCKDIESVETLVETKAHDILTM